MSDEALFNTQAIQREVKVVEDALSKLSRQIHNLNLQKADTIQAELAKLSSSSATSAKQMADNIKTAFDKALQAQKAYKDNSLSVNKEADRLMVAEAKAAVSRVIEAELAGYRKSIAERKAAADARVTLEAAADAKIRAGREANDARELATFQKKASRRGIDVSTVAGPFSTFKSPPTAQYLADAAKYAQSTKLATLAAVGDYSSLASGRLMRIRNAELFMNMPSREDYLAASAKAAAEASVAALAAKAQVKAATLAAAGDYSSLASGRLMRIRNAELFMNMPSREDYLAASAKAAAEAAAATARARAQVAAATNSATEQYQRFNAGTGMAGSLMNRPAQPGLSLNPFSNGTDAARQADAIGAAMGRLGVSSSTLHSLVRGLASGFNLLWMTWGSTLPLVAGAAISMSFTRAIKTGAEFSEKLFVIGELAGTSAAQVKELAQMAMSMGETTQYGPLEVAEALKVLSLAGLNAQKAMAALKPTLQFAAAGEVDAKEAAATLVAVATAYRYSADSFGVVGDIIAKTAADTQASVTDMSEAFKMSSVLAQQYGTTLEDTAMALGMLAQIGIKGTSAGTAWRNMMTEFNKGSGKAAEGIRELGVQLKNLDDGSSRNIMQVMKDVSSGLILKSASTQDKILQDITNERSAKATAAFQAQLLASLHKTNPLLQEQINYYHKIGKSKEADKLATDAVASAYAEMEKKMKDSADSAPNFSFFANLEGQFTELKTMKGLSASLSTALLQAFQASEGALLQFGLAMREVLNSEGFKTSITNIVSGVTTVITVFKDGSVALYDAVVWASDNILMALGVAISGYIVYVGAAALATQASVTAVTLYAGAVASATLAVNALNAAFAVAGIGLGLTLGGFALIAAAIAAAVLVLGSLAWNWTRSAETAEESARRQKEAAADVAEASVKGAESIMNSQRDQLDARVKSEQAEMDAYNKNKALQLSANAELRLAFEAKNKGNTAAAQEHTDKANELLSQMVSRDEVAVKAQGEAMKARIDQWAQYRLDLIETGREASILDKIITSIGSGLSIQSIEEATAVRVGLAKARVLSEAESRKVSLDQSTATLAALSRQKKDNANDDAKKSGKKVFGADDTGGYRGPKNFGKGGGNSADDDSKEKLERDLAAIRKNSAVITDDLKEREKVFEALRSAGFVGDKEYYEKKTELMRALGAQAENVLRQEIASREAAKFTGKSAASEAMANKTAIEELQAKLNKTVKENTTNLQVLGIQSDEAFRKIQQGFINSQRAAEKFLDTMKRTHARELKGFGMGEQARGEMAGRDAISDNHRAEQEAADYRRKDLERDDKFTPEERTKHDTDLARIQASLAAQLAEYDKHIQAKKALQKDWELGLSEGLNNYLSESRNVYGQAAEAATSALSGIENALVDLVMTGKADFRALATAILADIARIVIKMMVVKAIEAFAGPKNAEDDTQKKLADTAIMTAASLAALAATTAASVMASQVVAAAWAPAAAATSLASFGANSVPAMAGIAATNALTTAMSTPKGFMSGGYTGDIPTDEVAGVVHGGEFVINASATKRIGVENLKAMQAGIRPVVGSGAGSGSGSSSPMSVSIAVENHGTPQTYEQLPSLSPGEVRLIARDVVRQEAGKFVASTLANANSDMSKGLAAHTNLKRRAAA